MVEEQGAKEKGAGVPKPTILHYYQGGLYSEWPYIRGAYIRDFTVLGRQKTSEQKCILVKLVHLGKIVHIGAEIQSSKSEANGKIWAHWGKNRPY